MEKVNNTFRAKFYKLNYLFDMDGSITPFIQVYPAVKVPAGPSGNFVEIEHIDTDLIDNRNSLSIIPGDILEFDVHPAPNTDEGFSVHINVVSHSDESTKPITSKTCPICGAPLLPGTRGIGRCLNRSCKAQLTSTVLWILRSFDTAKQLGTKRIVTSLLASGNLDNIMDLYRVGPDELALEGYTETEIGEFLSEIHGVRGHVTLAQFLTALRVPGWNTSIVTELAEGLESRGYGLRNVAQFIHPSIQKEFKHVPWKGWDEMMLVPGNLELITRLATINAG